MRINRTAGIIAIAGVLLHAFALVRHHAVMLAEVPPPVENGLRVAAAFPYAFPLCRGNAASRPGEPGKQVPAAPHRPLPCPVCSGTATAFAVASSLVVFPLSAGSAALESAPPADRPREVEPAALPPARAPPLSA